MTAVGQTQLEGSVRALLGRLADRHPGRVVVVTCDSARSFRIGPMLDELGLRWVDVGVREGLAVTLSAGMAAEGMRPVVLGFSSFLTSRGLEAMRIYVDAERLPVTIIGGMSGLSAGRDGVSHHSLDDLARLRTLRNVRVYTPSDGPSSAWAVRDAVAADGASYLRLARVISDAVPAPPPSGPVREIRAGDGLAVCGYGPAFGTLATQLGSIYPNNPPAVLELLRCHPLGPGDLPLSLRRARRVLVVEEHQVEGGAADRLASVLPHAQVTALGVDRSPGSGSYRELLEASGITGEPLARRIAQAVDGLDDRTGAGSADREPSGRDHDAEPASSPLEPCARVAHGEAARQ